jgi:hypothetical protein
LNQSQREQAYCQCCEDSDDGQHESLRSRF